MKTAEVLIIGGGISGLMTAWTLLAEGRQVTLLERHVCGREASWAGGGILSPMYPWRYPDAVNALAKASQPHFEALAVELKALTGIDPEFFPTGMLMLDSEQWETAQTWCARWGYALEILDDRALALFEPRLRTERRLGLWMPGINSIRNPRLMKALATAVRLRGVEIVEHAPVETLDVAARQVITPQGRWQADEIVVTVGAWSHSLLPQLEIEPVRGQMIAIDAPAGFLRHMVMEQSRYLIPRRDGLIVVGSTVELGRWDKTPDADVTHALRDFALERYPELEMFEVVHAWAGIRPGKVDSVPYIGPVAEGVWVNAGHYRNGVVTSIASARLLADLMAGRAPKLDPTPYRPPSQC